MVCTITLCLQCTVHGFWLWCQTLQLQDLDYNETGNRLEECFLGLCMCLGKGIKISHMAGTLEFHYLCLGKEQRRSQVAGNSETGPALISSILTSSNADNEFIRQFKENYIL